MILAMALLLQSAYALLVWRLGRALARPDKERAAGNADCAGISVVIAARNEEQRIAGTLAALEAQSLERGRWELLVVDDRSRDGTAAVARAVLERLAAAGVAGRLLATTAERSGKKAAIDLGARAARHPWIAVLDADSRPGPRWLESLAAAARPGTGLLAGLVLFEADSLFTRVLRLEYAGLLGAGLATFRLGRALYASGANLCTRVAAYHEAGGYQGLEHVASADDTLLIQRLRLRTAWRLEALLDPAAAVTTRAPATLVALWRQRARWSSTERHLPDRAALAAAVGLYLVFLVTVLALPLAALGALSWGGALLLILLKLLPDAHLVSQAARRLGVARDLGLFPLAWLLQLGYGLTAPWAGTFGRMAWRGAAAEGRP
jgi:cellulose synthase/poly-beta-1,6-N-acetylglucosamine synthase-like glycosyltransferase